MLLVCMSVIRDVLSDAYCFHGFLETGFRATLEFTGMVPEILNERVFEPPNSCLEIPDMVSLLINPLAASRTNLPEDLGLCHTKRR